MIACTNLLWIFLAALLCTMRLAGRKTRVVTLSLGQRADLFGASWLRCPFLFGVFEPSFQAAHVLVSVICVLTERDHGFMLSLCGCFNFVTTRHTKYTSLTGVLFSFFSTVFLQYVQHQPCVHASLLLSMFFNMTLPFRCRLMLTIFLWCSMWCFFRKNVW